MNNFIFKSANRLTKNSSITLEYLDRQLLTLLHEQRLQRGDLKDINLKLQKLMIDKHLQMQVDEYYTEDSKQEDL